MSSSNLSFNIGGKTVQHITSGVAPEILAALVRQHGAHSELQRKEISRLESELDLNQRQVLAALEILGGAK